MSEENTVLPLLGIDGDDKMDITIEPQIHHFVAKVNKKNCFAKLAWILLQAIF